MGIDEPLANTLCAFEILPISVVKLHHRRCANTLCAYELLPILLIKLHHCPSVRVLISALYRYMREETLVQSASILQRQVRSCILAIAEMQIMQPVHAL